MVKLLQKKFLLKVGTKQQISVETKSYLSVKDALLRFENLLVIQLTHSKGDAVLNKFYVVGKNAQLGRVNCNQFCLRKNKKVPYARFQFSLPVFSRSVP